MADSPEVPLSSTKLGKSDVLLVLKIDGDRGDVPRGLGDWEKQKEKKDTSPNMRRFFWGYPHFSLREFIEDLRKEGMGISWAVLGDRGETGEDKWRVGIMFTDQKDRWIEDELFGFDRLILDHLFNAVWTAGGGKRLTHMEPKERDLIAIHAYKREHEESPLHRLRLNGKFEIEELG